MHKIHFGLGCTLTAFYTKNKSANILLLHQNYLQIMEHITKINRRSVKRVLVQPYIWNVKRTPKPIDMYQCTLKKVLNEASTSALTNCWASRKTGDVGRSPSIFSRITGGKLTDLWNTKRVSLTIYKNLWIKNTHRFQRILQEGRGNYRGALRYTAFSIAQRFRGSFPKMK